LNTEALFRKCRHVLYGLHMEVPYSVILNDMVTRLTHLRWWGDLSTHV